MNDSKDEQPKSRAKGEARKTKILTELQDLLMDTHPEGAADIMNDLLSKMSEADSLEFLTMGQALREGVERQEPTIGFVQEGIPLFYERCVNMLFGSDGVGKSLVMQKIAIQEAERGNQVLWIDYEEQTPATMAERFEDFAVDPAVADRIRTVHPTRGFTAKQFSELLEVAAECSLVVLDSVGEYLSYCGANENYDNEVARHLFTQFSRPLAAAGPCVVLIDHVPNESSGLRSAGSKRKRAGLTGASYALSLVDENAPWTRDTGGLAIATCAKDRHGWRGRGHMAGFLDMIPKSDAPLDITFTRQQPAGYEEMEGYGEPKVTRELYVESQDRAKREVVEAYLLDHEQPVDVNDVGDWALEEYGIKIGRDKIRKFLEENGAEYQTR